MNDLKAPKYKSVMVVDDNDIDRYIANRNIKKYGFAEEVILKESATSALEYLSSLLDNPAALPQLIFLDVRMPHIDGFGFLESYAKMPEVIKQSCIVILLSSSLNEVDHEKAKNNIYITQFITKPLDQNGLEQIHAR